ncbi:MAG: DnaT-like ssDNA-binding domain-containing protein [Pseudomonadota bacterium]
MTELPAPLVPIDCDLRSFGFMPLDVARLRDSDLAALESPEACWAAVLLWGASWHQLPAASLPDDDRVLANLAGYGRVVRDWLKIKAGALRGWVKCSDGRLYHPVVAEKANQAWAGKLQQSYMTECARIKKHCQRHKMDLGVPEFDVWVSLGCPSGNPLPVPRDNTSHSQHCPSGQMQLVPRDKDAMSRQCPSGNALQERGRGTGIYNNNSTNSSDPPPVRDSEFVEFAEPDGFAEGYSGDENHDSAAPVGMAIGWEPLPDLAARLVIAGIPLHLDTPASRAEFVSYWLGRPARASPADWTHKYFQNLQRIKTEGNHHARPQAQPANTRRGTPRQSVSDRVRAANGFDQPSSGTGVIIDATAE